MHWLTTEQVERAQEPLSREQRERRERALYQEQRAVYAKYLATGDVQAAINGLREWFDAR